MSVGHSVKVSNKILHVLGRMDRGGAETWLMNCIRVENQINTRYEVLCLKGGNGAYDDELKSLGVGVTSCSLRNLFTWPMRMVRILRTIKPNVVYSHCHYFSGIVLFLAFISNIKIRVAHSHLDTRLEDIKAGPVRKIYLKIMRILINIFATHRVYVSSFAGEALFGSKFKNGGHLLFPGIPITKNRAERTIVLKKELNLENRFVIGHVGRFSKQKNHEFLVKIFNALSRRLDNAVLLLVGGGELEVNIRQMVADLNLNDKVVFAGIRNDVSRILDEVIDVVCFPSLHEGLPVSLLEAQMLGVPCVISDTIAPEVCINSNVKRIAIELKNIQEWCDALISGQRVDPDLHKLESADVAHSVKFFANLAQSNNNYN